MKAWIPLIAAGLLLSACASSYEKASREWPEERRTTMNQWIASQYHAEATRHGVIAQHTLYSHHFVASSDQLNELGERDAAILAAHYRHNPGVLNVRRGNADDALYESRVSAARAALEAGGVDLARVHVADGPAGGHGMAGDFVITILNEKIDAPLTPDRPISGASGVAASGS